MKFPLAVFFLTVGVSLTAWLPAQEPSPFLKQYCVDCHGAQAPEAELSLATLDGDITQGRDIENRRNHGADGLAAASLADWAAKLHVIRSSDRRQFGCGGPLPELLA